MARKTLSVQHAVETANDYLANPDLSAEAKMGVARMIERILLDAGQYCGFCYNETRIHPVEHRDQWTPEMEASRCYAYASKV